MIMKINTNYDHARLSTDDSFTQFLHYSIHLYEKQF